MTTRTYDATKGRLTDISNPTGGSHYDYFALAENAAGQAPGALKAISGTNGTNLAFTYQGNLMTSTTWSGAVSGSVAWGYDNDFAHNSEAVTDAFGISSAIKFGYGDLDKFLTCASLTNCSPATDALSVAHNGNGLLSNVTFGALTETYGYDNFGQLANKTAKLGTTPLLQSTYDASTWAIANRRDALGRITHREETLQNAANPTRFDYQYSPEGRLTDVFINEAAPASEHYEYSLQNGNRTAGFTPQRSVTSADIAYDSQDRLRRYGPYTYTYANNGELKTKTDSTSNPAIVTTYAYDTLGNLLSVTGTNGLAITYVIDGMNRRVGKKVGGILVKQWLYRDSLKPVAELDGTGHLLSTFVYASNSITPDYMVRGGVTYRILADHVGSPRMVVDVTNAANVPFKAMYTAFGEPTIVGMSDFLPFGFAGGLYDVDTGLVRFGARDYDPMVGRWTSKDPIRFDGGQSNLYLYLDNDPINGNDIGGLGGCEKTLAAGALACTKCALTRDIYACVACALAGYYADSECLPHPPQDPIPAPTGCEGGGGR